MNDVRNWDELNRKFDQIDEAINNLKWRLKNLEMERPKETPSARTYTIVGARDLDNVAEKLGLSVDQHLMLKTFVQEAKSVGSKHGSPLVDGWTDEHLKELDRVTTGRKVEETGPLGLDKVKDAYEQALTEDVALRPLAPGASKGRNYPEGAPIFVPEAWTDEQLAYLRTSVERYAPEKRSFRIPKILWKKLSPLALVPTKSTPSAAAWDLYCVEDLVLVPGEQARVSTKIACAIPEGYYGQILGRSGLAARGVIVLGGVIDSDYRGELVVMLKNLGPLGVGFTCGDRVAQMAIVKIGAMDGKIVDELDDTTRGDKGFGSTGK